MGATLSYLGYVSQQRPNPPSHELAPQQLHSGSLGRPTLILSNEDAGSIADLYTRLGALEKDLQISRAENTNKEAVIQYLLQSNFSNVRFKETIVNLKGQVLALKTTINQTDKENKEIKDKLSKAEDTIFALSTPSVPISRPQSASTSFSSRSDIPRKIDLVAEDLIDLLDSSHESDSEKLMKEDTTLLDDSCEDESDIEGVFENTTPDQSLHQSSDLKFEECPYIVHFADSDENAESQTAVNVPTNKIRVPWGTSDSVTPLSELGTDDAVFTDLGDSSPEDSSPPSCPASTSTSFSSLANGMIPPEIASTNYMDTGFSQLATLASNLDEDGSLDRSVALVREMAETLPSLHARKEAMPSIPASTKLQKLPEKVNASAVEPRWTISETFDSSEERESAASVNRRYAGPDELRYPDLFKYGVHFSPPDSEGDVYRTIIISNISPDISLGTLLNHVRGGSVIDAKLLDTVKITGKKSALIVFLHEYAAMAFEDYAKKFPIIINGVAAQVRAVSTPTFPIRIPTRKAILDHHHSRCLEVYDFPGLISAQKLRDDLGVSMVMKTNRIIHMQKRKDGCLELQFSSVDWAGHAYGMLSSFRAYRKCTPYFVPDPCARPLESLKGQHMACTLKTEKVNKNSISIASDAEPAAGYQSGRLDKVEWESDPELCRGRGFATGS